MSRDRNKRLSTGTTQHCRAGGRGREKGGGGGDVDAHHLLSVIVASGVSPSQLTVTPPSIPPHGCLHYSHLSTVRETPELQQSEDIHSLRTLGVLGLAAR